MTPQHPTDFRALAEQMWQGAVDLVNAHHPVRSNYPGAQEFAPGLLYLKGTAGISVIDSGAGLVMLDAGTPRDIDRVFEAVRAWRPQTPLVAAVYSHHHIDHIWATRRFDEEAVQRGWPKPTVYAHALLPAHFDRYRKTQAWNAAINTRQFLTRQPSSGWPVDYRYPDVTFERGLSLQVGALQLEMHHARGETDDHVWVWVPQRKWLFPGDLFIWAVPNAGNPQKVQRYCEEWGTALREMAALGPEIMFCGHGMPIVGADRIRQALTDTAEYLESIERQTIALMNRALPLDEILQRVTPPEHLKGRPYLQAIYDHPQFLVRNIWRRYGGWWEGEPDMLLPAPRTEQAREWMALAGGPEPVLARIAELEGAGDLRMACHLVEMAMLADPQSSRVHTVRARLYAARSAREVATMSRGIFNHVAESSKEGQRDRLSQP
jgi:alkyl sulfatase BDS1-like metallo-beta-lactamase superfamily hydrolase